MQYSPLASQVQKSAQAIEKRRWRPEKFAAEEMGKLKQQPGWSPEEQAALDIVHVFQTEGSQSCLEVTQGVSTLLSDLHSRMPLSGFEPVAGLAGLALSLINPETSSSERLEKKIENRLREVSRRLGESGAVDQLGAIDELVRQKLETANTFPALDEARALRNTLTNGFLQRVGEGQPTSPETLAQVTASAYPKTLQDQALEWGRRGLTPNAVMLDQILKIAPQGKLPQSLKDLFCDKLGQPEPLAFEQVAKPLFPLLRTVTVTGDPGKAATVETLLGTLGQRASNPEQFSAYRQELAAQADDPALRQIAGSPAATPTLPPQANPGNLDKILPSRPSPSLKQRYDSLRHNLETMKEVRQNLDAPSPLQAELDLDIAAAQADLDMAQLELIRSLQDESRQQRLALRAEVEKAQSSDNLTRRAFNQLTLGDDL